MNSLKNHNILLKQGPLPQFSFNVWTAVSAFIFLVLYLFFNLILHYQVATSILFSFGSLVVINIFTLKIEFAIFAYVLYLLIEGALKINSNYNPVVHVSQDILLIFLVLRSLWDRSTNGINKIWQTPGVGFVVILLLWIFLQYLNPVGIGFLPSIAGTKIYISMIFLYMLVYHHLTRERINNFLTWILFLIILNSILSIGEYLYFQDWVVALHPRYADIILNRFNGIAYRPFGLSAVPGEPAIWLMLGAPICSYFLINFFNKRNFLTFAISILYLFVALPTLIFCQVRVAILITAVLLILPLFAPNKFFLKKILVTSLLLSFFSFMSIGNQVPMVVSNLHNVDSSLVGITTAQQRLLVSRIESLLNKDTYLKSRKGAFDELFELSKLTILGIGLSRVGAASAVWRERIDRDPYFGARWSFADNLFKAVFTELGLLGLLAWLILLLYLIGRLVFQVIKNKIHINSNLVWMLSSAALILLISGLGNEGLLYNPVSGFFWIFLAIGAKEVAYVH